MRVIRFGEQACDECGRRRKGVVLGIGAGPGSEACLCWTHFRLNTGAMARAVAPRRPGHARDENGPTVGPVPDASPAAVPSPRAGMIIPLFEAERLLVEEFRRRIEDDPQRAAEEWRRLFRRDAEPDIDDEDDGLWSN